MPGGEFLVAAKEAVAIGARIELGDRPVKVGEGVQTETWLYRQHVRLIDHIGESLERFDAQGET